MNAITADGVGKSIGTITIKESKDGVTIEPKLKDLPPGEHGFHIHEKASCTPADKDGKMTAGQSAGGHFDPAAPPRPTRAGRRWSRRRFAEVGGVTTKGEAKGQAGGVKD